MKTVLITGASRGIGKATAILFAQNGWKVAVNYKTNKLLAEAVCDEILSFGGMAKAFCADASKNTAVEKMIDEVKAWSGGIDVLVNNAGIALRQGLFTDFSEDDAKRIFDTNVFGMMNVSRGIIPHFVSKKSGKIINVSSIWGIMGGSCEVIYSASKAAVIGFTKALAKELAPSGICVNCALPGMIDTEMNSGLSDEEKDSFLEDVPLGRIGSPKDVAETIFFLASEGADYITGQVIPVDGGML